MRVLDGLPVKQDGILADLLGAIEPPEEVFEVVIGHLRFPFRGVTDYSELQDLADKATQFESLLRSGRVPQIPKDLVPPRPGVPAQAHYLATVCAHPEMTDPLPWLIIAKEAGPIFDTFVRTVDAHLGVRWKARENEAIARKKGSSRRARNSGTASS